MGSFAEAALAITMITAMLLLGFGVQQAIKPASRQRGLIMIACGVVFVVNVLIWTL